MRAIAKMMLKINIAIIKKFLALLLLAFFAVIRFQKVEVTKIIKKGESGQHNLICRVDISRINVKWYKIKNEFKSPGEIISCHPEASHWRQSRGTKFRNKVTE